MSLSSIEKRILSSPFTDFYIPLIPQEFEDIPVRVYCHRTREVRVRLRHRLSSRCPFRTPPLLPPSPLTVVSEDPRGGLFHDRHHRVKSELFYYKLSCCHVTTPSRLGIDTLH